MSERTSQLNKNRLAVGATTIALLATTAVTYLAPSIFGGKTAEAAEETDLARVPNGVALVCDDKMNSTRQSLGPNDGSGKERNRSMSIAWPSDEGYTTERLRTRTATAGDATIATAYSGGYIITLSESDSSAPRIVSPDGLVVIVNFGEEEITMSLGCSTAALNNTQPN